MFNDVTLYPGGAFMLCESIGEFDDNMPAPAPAAVPSDWNAEDPVIKLISKMKHMRHRRKLLFSWSNSGWHWISL